MTKLHGTSRSRSARSLWALEELGVTYEHLPMPTTEAKSAAHLKLNPNGHVPVLEDDGAVVWESMAEFAVAVGSRRPRRHLQVELLCDDRSRAASHHAVGQSRDGSAGSAQRESRAGRHRVFEGAAQRARGIAQGQGISARQEFYDRRSERRR